MEQPIFRVSELISVVNQTLEYAYPSVVVEGEVASFKVSKGKYVFFDLKDEEGVVGCFMMAYALRQPLEDGMKVRVVAQPRLTAWGKFSLNIRQILPVGEGSIKRAFQLLRTKLEEEGLFDPSRKRILPQIPGHVGVITSVESAGYADFIKILNQRWGGLKITIADVQVQGMSAIEQLIGAINHFNQLAEPPAVIVLIRGGGSAEDLSIFNDENLVRVLAASRIPTLVGVGHETDLSLADLVADQRAATPSNAAQILVPDRQSMLMQLTQREHRLAARIELRLKSIEQLANDASRQMLNKLSANITEKLHHVRHAELLLKQLDPKTVLRRGYAIARDANKKLVKDGSSIKSGDKLQIETANAIINVGVKDVRYKK